MKTNNLMNAIMTKKHPGFSNVQKKIAKSENLPMKEAGAILASSTRKAGKKAVKANPKLKKVKK